MAPLEGEGEVPAMEGASGHCESSEHRAASPALAPGVGRQLRSHAEGAQREEEAALRCGWVGNQRGAWAHDERGSGSRPPLAGPSQTSLGCPRRE